MSGRFLVPNRSVSSLASSENTHNPSKSASMREYGSSTLLIPGNSNQHGGANPSKRYPQRTTPHAALSIGLKRTSLFVPKRRHDGAYQNAVLSQPSLSDKFALSPDPDQWGTVNSLNHAEPDDAIHNPDPNRDRKYDKGGSVFTARGMANVGCLAFLCLGIVALFAGYPLISHFTSKKASNLGAFNIGGINASGQVPVMSSHYFSLIDPDTPKDAWSKKSLEDGSEMTLVFSDEFNVEGRTFYPGDDPYWEAVDLHYWATENLEWYDPVAITTTGGALKITFSQHESHNLRYQGGFLSSWNKFCFTGGYIEVNVSLPGQNNVNGLWPAVWTMGNLGRAGYGASLEGLWPYTYDACDVGALPNQTHNGLPINATINGDPYNDGKLSMLPGQRLSACTCPGEPHPGPTKSDGTLTGRSAPEIDIFEALIDPQLLEGFVSQSSQWAPFNYGYEWFNTTQNIQIHDPRTSLNAYTGGTTQQVASGLSKTNQQCYFQGGGCFTTYGFEYKRGYEGYITWVNDGKPSWTARGPGFAADPRVEISARPIPMEPMYIIMNLGMSRKFGTISPDIIFPTSMYVDYVRVYQPTKNRNIGCDPKDYPTAAYINRFPAAYTNYNLTTWAEYGQKFPKNKLVDQC